MPRPGVPEEVAAIREGLKQCLDHKDEQGRSVGNAQCGIYAFYDYDGEPIYVGQTAEGLRRRIGRHLTNHRTDAVAMNVLDPFEVLEIEMWPLWELKVSKHDKKEVRAERKKYLDRAEYTVYRLVLERSTYGAVLNEKDIAKEELITLPPSYRCRIVPKAVYELRKHPDIRIARRASTIANLARVLSERKGSVGLRRTLLTQARRLERLAQQRFAEFEAVPHIAGEEEEEELDGEEDAEDEKD
jgi:hypothetical protein